jgi:hypothetical protein
MLLTVKIIGWFLLVLYSLMIMALIAEDKKKPLERLLSVLLQGLGLFYVSWTLFK